MNALSCFHFCSVLVGPACVVCQRQADDGGLLGGGPRAAPLPTGVRDHAAQHISGAGHPRRLLRAPRPSPAVPTAPTHPRPRCWQGGNYQRRGDDNIAMLAKMRMVMIEKWEGPCWTECLASNNSQPPVAASDPPPPFLPPRSAPLTAQHATRCTAACHVETYILDTLRRVKAVNPAVSGVMYLNTLLDFPFYSLHGRYVEEAVVAMDSVTKKPIQIRNE